MRCLRLVAGALTAPLVLAISACAMSNEVSDVPAKIVGPTAESRAELQRAVSKALDGMPVTLADDALTRESILTIERQQARDSSGQRIDAREIERPELFRLVKRGSDCVLVHEQTLTRTTLRSTRCD
jgi:hypothetical protein